MGFFSMKRCLCIGFLVILAGCGGSEHRQFRSFTVVKTEREKEAIVTTLKKKHLTKNIKDMTIEEALNAKQYYEHLGRLDRVAKLIPHIISLTKDAEQIANLSFELADIEVSLGNIDSAFKLYSSFVSMYPGSEHNKAARHHQVMTSYWRMLPSYLDQTITQTTLSLAKSYLSDFPDEDAMNLEVQKVLVAAYGSLLEHELATIRFYLHRFYLSEQRTQFDAAYARFLFFEKEILPILAATGGAFKRISQEIDEKKDSWVAESDEKLQKEQQQKFLETVVSELEAALAKLESFETGDAGARTGPHPRDTF